MNKPHFPNGFDSWYETHYEIVAYVNDYINQNTSCPMGVIGARLEEYGQGGMYDLTREWTDLFERKFQGEEWGVELIYQDELENFLREQNNAK